MILLKKFSIMGALGVAGFMATSAGAQQGQSPNAQKGNAGVGANAGANIGANAQRGLNGGIRQTPWFGNPNIRQQLQLNDEQYNQLNQSYTQSWQRYNQGLSGLDRNLNEQQRMQRMQEMNGCFQKDFSNSVNETLADKAARQRFNQMEWQYRGYDAFNDTTLQQQLKLNDEQRKKFAEYQNEWSDQMRSWQPEYAKDRDGVATRFREARRAQQERINSTLTPEQRQMWTDLYGKPFDFPDDVYFDSNSSSNSNANPPSNKPVR